MALTNKKKLLAELMASEPELTNIQYSDRIGIDNKTLYRWKKEAEFQDYLHQCCRENFKDIEKIAIKRLKENVKNGNQKAIQYALDYLGYKPEEKLTVKNLDIEIDIED